MPRTISPLSTNMTGSPSGAGNEMPTPLRCNVKPPADIPRCVTFSQSSWPPNEIKASRARRPSPIVCDLPLAAPAALRGRPSNTMISTFSSRASAEARARPPGPPPTNTTRNAPLRLPTSQVRPSRCSKGPLAMLVRCLLEAVRRHLRTATIPRAAAAAPPRNSGTPDRGTCDGAEPSDGKRGTGAPATPTPQLARPRRRTGGAPEEAPGGCLEQ
mmetsp:Transcript_81406/g.264290  ORF Transcript_81406/g.264290 Transcript_81406/m.264290 type:complete len:215 (-) Transcript_81406:98-742(-)